MAIRSGRDGQRGVVARPGGVVGAQRLGGILQPRPQVAYDARAELASAQDMEQLGRELFAESIGQLKAISRDRGRQAGLALGAQVDEQGRPVPMQLPSGFTEYDKALREAARTTYQASLRNHARAQAQKLADQFPDDPDRWRGAFQAYAEETLSLIEDPELATVAQIDMTAIGSLGVLPIMEAQTRRARQEELDAKTLDIENLTREITELALKGQGDDPLIVDRQGKIAANLATLADRGLITAADAERQLRDIQSGVVMSTMVGQARLVLERGDVAGALRYADRLRSDDGLDVPLEQRQKAAELISALAHQRINFENTQRALHERAIFADSLRLVQEIAARPEAYSFDRLEDLYERGRLTEGHLLQAVSVVGAWDRDEAERVKNRQLEAGVVLPFERGERTWAEIQATVDQLPDPLYSRVIAAREARRDDALKNLRDGRFITVQEQLLADPFFDPAEIAAAASAYLTGDDEGLSETARQIREALPASLDRSRLEGFVSRYRTAHEKARKDAVQMADLRSRATQGLPPASREQEKLLEEPYGEMLQPANLAPEDAADFTATFHYVPGPLRDAFGASPLAMTADEGQKVYEIYRAVAATPEGRAALANSNVGSTFWQRLDVFVRSADLSKENWFEGAWKLAVAEHDEGSAASRRLSIAVSDPDNPASWRAYVSEGMFEPLANNEGFFRWIGLVDSNPLMRQLLQQYGQAGFSTDDLAEADVPQQMLDELGTLVRSAIATGRALPSDKPAAMEWAFNKIAKTWGPQRTFNPDRPVEWVRHPISTTADRTSWIRDERGRPLPKPLPDGFSYTPDNLDAEIRWQLRRLSTDGAVQLEVRGVETKVPVDDLDIRFEAIDETMAGGLMPEWEVLVRPKGETMANWQVAEFEDKEGRVRSWTFSPNFYDEDSLWGTAHNLALAAQRDNPGWRALRGAYLDKLAAIAGLELDGPLAANRTRIAEALVRAQRNRGTAARNREYLETLGDFWKALHRMPEWSGSADSQPPAEPELAVP